jgi:hypothetical protein
MEATMLFSRTVKSAATLLLLTIGFAAPVHAQNNKQIISGTWYEDRAATATPVTSSEITLTFTQTPNNQFLNITNVACNIGATSAQVVTGMILTAGTTSGANDLGRYYELKGNVTPETISSTKFYSIVQNGIFYKFGPGRFPSIQLSMASTGSYSTTLFCTIVGNLSDS